MLKRSCPNKPSSLIFATMILVLDWTPANLTVNSAVPNCDRGCPDASVSPVVLLNIGLCAEGID